MTNILALIKIQKGQHSAYKDPLNRLMPNNMWEIYVFKQTSG
jgi:hypothetical protein